MLDFLRGGYADLITSGGYLLLVVVGVKTEAPAGWLFALVMIAIIAFLAWMSTFRRSRSIADTPTSKIGSAAQGYVEIYGPSSRAPEYQMQATAGSQPCVWFRCITYQRTTDNKWREIGRQVSDGIFEISDETGKCMIDPDHAEVITTHRRTWYEDDYKYVEDQLFAMDKIYALGEFATIGGANSVFDIKADVQALLGEWKRDPGELLKRFDLDGNGEIDLKEWQLARNAARREVEKQHRELRLQTGVHVMRQPKSGQLYLLSNLSPQQLHRRYAMWSWFHLTAFFGGIGGATWVSLHHALNG
jgi:hypothetical protein